MATASGDLDTNTQYLRSIDEKQPALSGGKVPVTGPLTAAEFAAADPATSANQQPAATTVTMDSITLIAANTEYSKALPANCKKLTFRCVDSTKIASGSDIRYAFETDKVHDATLPFMLLDGGAVYSESDLNLSSKTLYVAGITAGDIVLLEMWS
jgi:hypothetical protein